MSCLEWRSSLTNLLNSKMNIRTSTREVAVLNAKNAGFLFCLINILTTKMFSQGSKTIMEILGGILGEMS